MSQGNWTNVTNSTTWAGGYADASGDYYVTPWIEATPVIESYPMPDQSELERRVRELEEKLRKEEPRMLSLYKVYVVDPRKLGKLLDETIVIAETEEQALLKAGVAQTAEKAGLELEQVDTLVDQLGAFIRPRKETQRVKMVKEDED